MVAYGHWIHPSGQRIRVTFPVVHWVWCVEWHCYVPISSVPCEDLGWVVQDCHVAALYLLQGGKLIWCLRVRDFRVQRPTFIIEQNGHDFCIACRKHANHLHLHSKKHLRRVNCKNNMQRDTIAVTAVCVPRSPFGMEWKLCWEEFAQVPEESASLRSCETPVPAQTRLTTVSEEPAAPQVSEESVSCWSRVTPVPEEF